MNNPWISADERKPNEGQEVFAISPQYDPKHPVVLRWQEEAWYDPDFDGYDEGSISSAVTYWMPIPPIPETR